MKTIEEAIAHALSKADELGACECGNDHRQLAEWLKELRDYKTGTIPLCDRLTSEERWKIEEFYMLANLVEDEYNRGYKNALTDIFGTAMFEEKGGEDEA